MESSEFTFKLLLVFFPGILCSYIVDALTVHSPRSTFSFILRSFVFGILAYLLSGITTKLLYESESIDQFFAFLTEPGKNKFNVSHISWASLSGIGLGLFTSFAENHKWLHRVAQKTCITNKFGELDVWGYTLNMKDIDWVIVRDHVNDLAFKGWVQAFSDDSKDAELLLRDVSVYNNTEGEEPIYQVGALYISRERQNISIESITIAVDEAAIWKEGENHE